MTLPDGLYDQLLTEALRDAVNRTTDEHAHSLKPLTAEDAPERLADALAAQLSRILDDLHGDGAEKLREQLDLVNFLLVSLKHSGNRAGLPLALHRGQGLAVAADRAAPRAGGLRSGGHPGELHHAFRRAQAARRAAVRSPRSAPDGRPRTRLRILTTTYTGATEIRALDELARCRVARSACRSMAAAPACTPRPGCSSAAPASARPTWAAPTCRARP
jgi:hypothetical protein